MGADDYTIKSSLNQALFGFGDAVCVPVIRWVAENYLNPLLEELCPPPALALAVPKAVNYLKKTSAARKAV